MPTVTSGIRRLIVTRVIYGLQAAQRTSPGLSQKITLSEDFSPAEIWEENCKEPIAFPDILSQIYVVEDVRDVPETQARKLGSSRT